METGRVVRFDENRGYGFIAPDDGGEDVFVHAKELNELGVRVTVGTRMRFKVVEGGRGLKAYDLQLADDDADAARGPQPAVVDRPLAEGAERPKERPLIDDDTCEILSEREFLQQVTNLLLESASYLTGAQIIDIRQAMVQFARKNGWVDD